VSLVCHFCVTCASLLCYLSVTFVSLICHLHVSYMSLVCHFCDTCMSLVCHLHVTCLSLCMSLVCHFCDTCMSLVMSLFVTCVSFVCHLHVTFVPHGGGGCGGGRGDCRSGGRLPVGQPWVNGGNHGSMGTFGFGMGDLWNGGPSNSGPSEWRTLGIADLRNGGPSEWQIFGMADRNQSRAAHRPSPYGPGRKFNFTKRAGSKIHRARPGRAYFNFSLVIHLTLLLIYFPIPRLKSEI